MFKKKDPAINGLIGMRVPPGVVYTMKAEVLRLREEGVDRTPMKMAYIEYAASPVPDKAERGKILAKPDADDRVLFSFKGNPG
ncbi:MAG: hypothetical protein Q7T80_17260 [Methanoregula sp.]|nr:hypothetical protein [Methanoregula sp.]